MVFEHKEIAEVIIGSAFEVHNVLGYGSLEKVYQNALQEGLIRRGHQCRIQTNGDVT